jgi:hypothetical protein
MGVITVKNKEVYQRISPYIEQAARDYYRNNLEKGFLHWAFSEIFIQEDFSDDDVITHTAIDGPDDFGIDGYFIDHESKTIHLFQAKHLGPGRRLDEAFITDFWESPKRLTDSTRIVKCKNEETRKLSSEFMKYLPENYALHMVIATTGELSPSSEDFVAYHRNAEETIILGTSKIPITIEFESYDLKGLIALFEKHLSWVEVAHPDVVIQLIPERFHEIHQTFNAMEATIHAKEIVRIFEENSFRIFRLNPRGPLVNKVNKEMFNSLQNSASRPIFHLLNNGLSVTCDSYKLEGSKLKVRNFQIVNGCQTTVTLSKAKPFLGDTVMVNIRIIESPPAMAATIAQTTNTQAGLKAQDFISTDPRQLELQLQFSVLSEPWFYEIRRGEWAKMTRPSDKLKYRRPDGTYRVMKIKDVAQAALAFRGMPGEAKDHTKTIFQHKLSDSDIQNHYEDVFSPSITAKQLYLSWLILAKVKSIVASKDTASDYPGYGRLHSVWLVGELIRTHYGISNTETVSESLAVALTNTMEDWFEPLYFLVEQTLKMAVDSEREAKPDTYSHREFFRGTRSVIKDKLPVALSYAKQFGSDPLQKLPRWKKQLSAR